MAVLEASEAARVAAARAWSSSPARAAAASESDVGELLRTGEFERGALLVGDRAFGLSVARSDLRLGLGDRRALRFDLAADAGDRRVLVRSGLAASTARR